MDTNNKKPLQYEDRWYVWYMDGKVMRNKVFPAASNEYFEFLNSLPPERIVTKRF